MTGLVRRATLITAVGLLAASAAMAGVPSASTSTVPTNINLGQTDAGGTTLLSLVEKTVVVRDAGNNLVPGSVVIINFTNCTNNDFRLCGNQPFAGVTANCAGHTVSAVTNGVGVATFRIAGGASFAGANGPGLTAACATITADGVPLGNLMVGAYDLNNSGGVNPADASLYLSDANGLYRMRSDFDGNGLINPADGSLYLQAANGFPGGGTSCGATCP